MLTGLSMSIGQTNRIITSSHSAERQSGDNRFCKIHCVNKTRTTMSEAWEELWRSHLKNTGMEMNEFMSFPISVEDVAKLANFFGGKFFVLHEMREHRLEGAAENPFEKRFAGRVDTFAFGHERLVKISAPIFL